MPRTVAAGRSGSLQLPGRLLKASSNRRRREMAIARAEQSARSQNPAYTPTRRRFFVVISLREMEREAKWIQNAEIRFEERFSCGYEPIDARLGGSGYASVFLIL